jgi:hypothetical protein
MKWNPTYSSLNFIVISSFHLHPGLQSGLFHSDFVMKILYGFITGLHVCCMFCSSCSPWFHHPNNIWWQVHSMKVLPTSFSPVLCYIPPLGFKYSPNTHSICLSFIDRDQVHTHTNQQAEMYIVLFTLLPLLLCQFKECQYICTTLSLMSRKHTHTLFQ